MITNFYFSPIISTSDYDLIYINDLNNEKSFGYSITNKLDSLSNPLGQFYTSFKISDIYNVDILLYNNTDIFTIFLRNSILQPDISSNQTKFDVNMLFKRYIKPKFLENSINDNILLNDTLMLSFNYFVNEIELNNNIWNSIDFYNNTIDCLYAVNFSPIQKPMLLNNYKQIGIDSYQLDDYFINSSNTNNILLLSLILNKTPFNSVNYYILCEFYDDDNNIYHSKSLVFDAGQLNLNSGYFVFNPFPTDISTKTGYCLIFMRDYTDSIDLTYRFDIKKECSKYDKYKLHYVDWNGSYSQLQFSYKSKVDISMTKDTYLP